MPSGLNHKSIVDEGYTLGALEYVVVVPCSKCSGTGEVTAEGIPPGSTTCPRCDGEGKVVKGEIYAID